MQRILIADDQQMIHVPLTAYLKDAGYEVISAMNGREALELFALKKPDLMILDIMMPEINGMDVCREIRKTSRMPIIMLTAKGEEIDRILGLELGADDYIVKPFSAKEVVARVRAVLRRINDAKEKPPAALRFCGLTVSMDNYDVRVDGTALPLTPKEVEILYLLASHPGKVFTREEILAQVWDYEFFGDTRAVDTQIKRIRQKLPESSDGWGIKTVYGVGYKFEPGAR